MKVMSQASVELIPGLLLTYTGGFIQGLAVRQVLEPPRWIPLLEGPRGHHSAGDGWGTGGSKEEMGGPDSGGEDIYLPQAYWALLLGPQVGCMNFHSQGTMLSALLTTKGISLQKSFPRSHLPQW